MIFFMVGEIVCIRELVVMERFNIVFVLVIVIFFVMVDVVMIFSVVLLIIIGMIIM